MKLIEPRQPRRRAVTVDETRLWQAVIHDVHPLPGRRAPDPVVASPEPEPVPTPPPPPGSPPRRPSAAAPAPRRAADGLPTLSHGHTPGLDRRTAERLKRGELAIDGTLDLHGLTQDSARTALGRAIERAWAVGDRVLLVVTGKGNNGDGVLRHQVPRWLNQSPLRERILSFCHAKANHGGEGALYVLIRRRRDRLE